MSVKVLVHAFLLITLLGSVSAVDQGDGYKVGVIIGTVAAALICFGVILCLIYYLVARKWIQERYGGNRGPIYQVGSSPPLAKKDYQSYQTRAPPIIQPSYNMGTNYEKE